MAMMVQIITGANPGTDDHGNRAEFAIARHAGIFNIVSEDEIKGDKNANGINEEGDEVWPGHKALFWVKRLFSSIADRCFERQEYISLRKRVLY